MTEHEEISQDQDRLIAFAAHNPVFNPSVSEEAIQQVTEMARSRISNQLIDPSGFDNKNLIYLLPVIDDSDLEDVFSIFGRLGYSNADSLSALRSMAIREFASIKTHALEYSVSEYASLIKILHVALIKLGSFGRRVHSLELAKSIENSPDSLAIFKEVISSRKVDMRNNQVQK